jgi:hypothetical protein
MAESNQCSLLQKRNILWHVDQMLGNNREISTYTTVVTRHQPLNSNRDRVLSVRSVLRCYKQDKLGVAVR